VTDIECHCTDFIREDAWALGRLWKCCFDSQKEREKEVLSKDKVFTFSRGHAPLLICSEE
jgi:hypothetical protein